MARPFGTKKIKEPELLWELFEKYRLKVKNNPRLIFEFVGKEGREVEKKLECPLTMEGFECFCFDLDITVCHYFDNQHGNYDDYCTVCSRIRREIRQDQINGGMVGQYNPSITQRLNGLKEHVDNNINLNIPILNIDPLDDSKD